MCSDCQTIFDNVVSDCRCKSSTGVASCPSCVQGKLNVDNSVSTKITVRCVVQIDYPNLTFSDCSCLSHNVPNYCVCDSQVVVGTDFDVAGVQISLQIIDCPPPPPPTTPKLNLPRK